ncbi:MAG: hypothetical protein CME64_06090 [Halobacteriovoraceae bacterium]|nr:hypothetical protein [Halobacteriovoraceae bacterium]|tara:strand:+ start:126027 stop:127028 length:1002 start_codon:yes stop_codon:yes gene_type:complete
MTKITLIFASLICVAWATEFGAQFDIESIYKKEISNNQNLESVKVRPSFLDGYVTLDGHVENLWQKERLIEIGQSINGAKGVIDKLEVVGFSVGSKEISKSIAQALYEDEVSEIEELKISSDDFGRVLLRGEVDSQQEKNAAEDVIKRIPGIKSVQNSVEVVSNKNRSNEDKAKDIEYTLTNTVLIDERLIEPSVKKDVAILKGNVGSEMEAQKAKEAANSVRGIKETRITDLTVVPSFDRTLVFKLSPRETNISDEELASIVDKANYYDTRVFSYDIDVSAKNGIIQLDGVAHNEKAREAAIENANNVLGVRGVNDNLSVGEFAPGEDVFAE